MSQLQEEQTITQQSSQHGMLHQQHPHTAATLQSTGGHIYTQSNNQHQRKVQNAIKASRSKVNSNQWVRNGNVKAWTDSGAVSADSSVEQSHASSAKLKGRLGHLVAAIAEAHTSSSSINMERLNFSNGTHNSKPGGPSLVHTVHSNAWMPADSSLDCIEVHTCSKCDKMYSNREALEDHQSICTL